MEKNLDWLMATGGAVVKWRAANELLSGVTEAERNRLAREVIASPAVQAVVQMLDPVALAQETGSLTPDHLRRLGNHLHGSRPDCLENVFGRLAEYGLRPGMGDLDERTRPLFNVFDWPSAGAEDYVYQSAWLVLVKSVIAWGLLRLGYAPSEAMMTFIRGQISEIARIACDQVFDIYADDTELVGLPKAWAGKPVMKQVVMREYRLPLIHDLYLMSALPANIVDDDLRGKMDAVLAYILDPRFQALRDGYGYAWIRERRTCYGWGWSPHLYGFSGLPGDPAQLPAAFLQRVELMAHFDCARQTGWFHGALAYLRQFEASEGRYSFPPNLLADKPSGYYVSGFAYGLGENRRSRRWQEVESTFRMSLIERLAGAQIP